MIDDPTKQPTSADAESSQGAAPTGPGGAPPAEDLRNLRNEVRAAKINSREAAKNSRIVREELGWLLLFIALQLLCAAYSLIKRGRDG
jgi:hypothetical protein